MHRCTNVLTDVEFSSPGNEYPLETCLAYPTLLTKPVCQGSLYISLLFFPTYLLHEQHSSTINLNWWLWPQDLLGPHQATSGLNMQIPEMHECTNVLTAMEFLVTCQNPPRQPVPGWDLHLNALPPLPPLLWLHLPPQHLHRQPKAFHPPSVLRQDSTSPQIHILQMPLHCPYTWKPASHLRPPPPTWHVLI